MSTKADQAHRPPTTPPLSLLCRSDLDPAGHSVDDFAERIAALDGGAQGRARALVRLPAPVPTGVPGVLAAALSGIRRALFTGAPAVAEDARFVVADGFAGTALGAGVTIEEAERAFRADLFRAKPRPPDTPAPQAPPPPDDGPRKLPSADGPRTVRDDEGKVTAFSTGIITLSEPPSGGPPIPWPPAVPDKIPAAAVPLPPPPPAPPEALARIGFNRWLRFVGQHGVVSHALLREEPPEFGAGATPRLTFLGQHVLDLVDPATLDAELDEADAAQRRDDAEMHARFGNVSAWDDPQFHCAILHYRLWDDDRRLRTAPRRGRGAWVPRFDPAILDGDDVAYSVTRIVPLRAASGG